MAPAAKTIVFLAAGIGSRYGGLKQMDPIGPSGEFIVDYSAFDAIRAGFEQLVFVIRRDIEDAFRSTIGKRVEKHIPTRYVFQELSHLPEGYALPSGRKKPWGTAHAVLTCAGTVAGPFVAANADDFYGRESYVGLARFLDDTAHDDSGYCMPGYVLRKTLSQYGSVARGICRIGSDDCLEHIVERTNIEKDGDGVRCPEQSLTGDEIVSMNIWGLKQSAFAHFELEFCRFLDTASGDPKAEFFVPTVIDKLLADGKVSVTVFETAGSWFGVTNREDKAGVVERVRDLVSRREYPENLWA